MEYKTRQLRREDLPKNRRSAESLHLPVLFTGQLMYVCDIHFTDDGLCWLEQAKGIPTPIAKLDLVLSRSSSEIKQDIKRNKLKLKQNSDQKDIIYNKLKQLQRELMETI